MREPPDDHTPDDTTEHPDEQPTMTSFVDRLDAIAAKVGLVAAIWPEMETFLNTRAFVAFHNALIEAEEGIDALSEDFRRLPHS